jgi:hypothetical protein
MTLRLQMTAPRAGSAFTTRQRRLIRGDNDVAKAHREKAREQILVPSEVFPVASAQKPTSRLAADSRLSPGAAEISISTQANR